MLRYLRKIRTMMRGNSFLMYKAYIKKDISSILLSGFIIRFDNNNRIEKRTYVSIGENCIIGANFIFETEKGNVKIGNNVHLGSVTFISRNSIEIEDDVTMAWDITIYDHNSHSIYWEERKNDNHNCYNDYLKFNGNNIVTKDWTNVKDAPIKICSKAWVGFGVTILKGVVVGEGAVIGAKSLVTKNVEPWTVVAGNPVRVIKYLPGYKKNA